MNRTIITVLSLGLISMAMVGCNKVEKSSVKQETKIATPGGTTTITTERDVKKTGEKPPGTNP